MQRQAQSFLVAMLGSAALEAPQTISHLVAKRRQATPLAVPIAQLTPLFALAACGGGGVKSMPAPVVVAGQADAVTIAAGQPPVLGNVLANDTSSGSTLVVAAVAAADGSSATVGQPVAGSLGTLTVNAGGNFSFAVANNAAVQALGAGQTATNIFTYTPSAGGSTGAAQSITVTVIGVNDAPSAMADTAAGNEHQVLTIDVLANDTDVDTGDSKSLVSATVPKGIATVADGKVQFDPGTAFDGLGPGQTETVVISYTMRDAAGATSSSSVTVTVSGSNDAPSAAPDTFSIGENTIVSIPVLSNDTDPDAGDTKALVRIDSVSVTSQNGAVNGIDASSAISIGPAPFVALNQLIQFVPGSLFDALNPGQTATVTIGYTMRDTAGATSASTLTVTVLGQTDMVGNLNLGALGTAGLAIAAPAGLGGFGRSLAGGNVDNDSSAELIVGAPTNGAGSVLVYSVSSAGAVVDRTLTGSSAGDRFGFDAGVGQFGGSSVGDVLIGAPGVSNNAGAGYVFYGGGAANTPAALNGGSGAGFAVTTADLGGTAAFPDPAANMGGNLGAAVAALGSVNADARDDYFLAAPGADSATAGITDRGLSVVGFTPLEPANTTLAALSAGGAGLTLPSDDKTDELGFLSAASGNINGLGGADLVVGYPGRDNDGGAATPQGAVLIAFSNIDTGAATLNFQTLDGTNGARLITLEANAQLGASVAAGDVSGDGRADVIVGAPGAGGDGKVYILIGAETYPSGGAINVASPPPGVRVFEIDGVGGFGTSVAYLGDYNGDGVGDFIVGAPNEGANGRAYILLGTSALSSASFTNTHYPLGTPNRNVIRLDGAQPGTGMEVAGPGDLDGDGLADAAVSANEMVYVLFGRGGQSGNAFLVEPDVLGFEGYGAVGHLAGGDTVPSDPFFI